MGFDEDDGEYLHWHTALYEDDAMDEAMGYGEYADFHVHVGPCHCSNIDEHAGDDEAMVDSECASLNEDTGSNEDATLDEVITVDEALDYDEYLRLHEDMGSDEVVAVDEVMGFSEYVGRGKHAGFYSDASPHDDTDSLDEHVEPAAATDVPDINNAADGVAAYNPDEDTEDAEGVDDVYKLRLQIAGRMPSGYLGSLLDTAEELEEVMVAMGFWEEDAEEEVLDDDEGVF